MNDGTVGKRAESTPRTDRSWARWSGTPGDAAVWYGPAVGTVVRVREPRQVTR